MKYIWESANWPNFSWDKEEVANSLLKVLYQEGVLNGKMSAMGLEVSDAGFLSSICSEVINSSEIENDKLSTEDVRSSIVNHLGIKNVVLSELHSNVVFNHTNNTTTRASSVVEVTIDAIQNSSKPLTVERLQNWQILLFTDVVCYPAIQTGKFRTDKLGPMQVVSGPIGREKVHYQAPPADKLEDMVNDFILWFNTPSCEQGLNHIVKSAIAHLYFVSLHPFEDGNGRISRAIAEMELSKDKKELFSISAQLCKDKASYYEILKSVQTKIDLDITEWIVWYLDELNKAIDSVLEELDMVVFRKNFWISAEKLCLNDRQKKILGLLITKNFEGNLTSTKWAKMCKCSQDTASRDINKLIQCGLLVKSDQGGRSTNYILVEQTK